MKNVIQFPKKGKAHPASPKSSEVKKLLASLLLFSLLVAVVITHESAMQSTSGHGQGRWLASDASQESDRLQWEQDLIRRLSEGSPKDRKPANVGEKLSDLDRLRFETLAGAYRIFEGQEISQDSKTYHRIDITFEDTKVGVPSRSLKLSPDSLIPAIKSAFQRPDLDFRPKSVPERKLSSNARGQEEIRIQYFNLHSNVTSPNSEIGEARFEYGPEGQLLGIHILTLK